MRTDDAARRARVHAVILASLIAQALGNVYLTRGMKAVGDVDISDAASILSAGRAIFTSGSIWLGIAGLGLFTLLYLVALSWADLSYVLAVSAVGYVVNAFVAWGMLGEQLSVVRWAGTILICAGVALVSPTPPRTTEPAAR